MNLHLLRLFSAVVEYDGVVSAAKALRLSQPAVSRAVRELETQIGLPLLERTSRRVRLTPEGKEIYRHAREVYSAERMVEDSIARLKGLRQGTLHIGASTTIATYVLPKFIGEFARRLPASRAPTERGPHAGAWSRWCTVTSSTWHWPKRR